MKYIFKSVFISTEIGTYYNMALEENINDGWEVFHLQKGFIIFSKKVSDEEYKEILAEHTETVNRMNNSRYLD